MNNFNVVHSPGDFARSSLFYILIAGLDAASADFFLERHEYPAYELLFIVQGKGWFRQGGEWIELNNGDVLLYDMHLPHAYRADPDDPFQMKFVLINGVGLDTIWRHFFDGTVLHLPDRPEHALVNEWFEAIFEFMKDDLSDKEAELSVHVYQLMILLLRLHKAEYAHAWQSRPKEMTHARDYIDTHFTKIRSIREVAKEVGFSTFHFTRQFHLYFGCTPKDYLTAKRLDRAKTLLISTMDTIDEITYLSGFGSYNAFIRAFVNREKCTPLEYRKQMRRPFRETL